MQRRRRRDPSGPRVFEATEPRGYDRRFYAGSLLLAFTLIVLTAGFGIYMTAFNPAPPAPSPYFDFSTLLTGGRSLADRANPALVLQEHLEAIHTRAFHTAYGHLCSGLARTTGYEEFVSNASENRPLFQDIENYSFPGFELRGTAASVSGYVNYSGGGRSRVRADFAREGDGWKLAIMTVIYE